MGGCYHVRLLLIAVERYFKVIPCLILSFRTPKGPPEYRLRNGREIGRIDLRGNKGASCCTLTQSGLSWIFWVWVCHGCHCVPDHLRTG